MKYILHSNIFGSDREDDDLNPAFKPTPLINRVLPVLIVLSLFALAALMFAFAF